MAGEGFDPQPIYDAIAALDVTLEEILERLTSQPGGPWRWDMLEDKPRLALWDQLFEFVGWLDKRYMSKVSREAFPLQPCWFQHDVAVELLTALMVAYMSVYKPQATVASFGLLDWHERCLWPTFERLKRLDVFKKCSATEHKVDESKALTMDRDAFDKFVSPVPAENAGTGQESA